MRESSLPMGVYSSRYAPVLYWASERAPQYPGAQTGLLSLLWRGAEEQVEPGGHVVTPSPPAVSHLPSVLPAAGTG